MDMWTRVVLVPENDVGLVAVASFSMYSRPMVSSCSSESLSSDGG